MGPHVDPITNKTNTFRSQAKPLLKTVLSRQANASFGPEHPMPRKPVRSGISKRPDHLPCGSSKAGHLRYRTVCHHFSSRNGSNHRLDAGEHSVFGRASHARYSRTRTSSPSNFSGYTGTLAAGFCAAAPVFGSNSHPCHGHTTLPWLTNPCPRGPPR